MNWYLEPIDTHIDSIKELFAKTQGHKHADNYSKWPLFQYTKFARMAYDPHMIYYSAGIERPEYNGSIRIMSRHVRDRDYNFGGRKADLQRGLTTLDESTRYALELGYKNIWVSREENPKLLEYFANNSTYNWTVSQEAIPGNWTDGKTQWILRLA
jgi:hypothetical protein